VVNDQLQLCICSCSGNVKCSDSSVDIVFQFKLSTAEDVLSHIQPTTNHMGQDLENTEDVLTPPPQRLSDFAHHDGKEVLHCPGGKLHHA